MSDSKPDPIAVLSVSRHTVASLDADLARESERADRAELDHSLLVDDYNQLLISLARERDNLLNEGASNGYVWVDRSVYETTEAALVDLRAKHDDLVRILITDGHREDCCDLVNDWCDAWLAENPEPQTEAPGGVPGA